MKGPQIICFLRNIFEMRINFFSLQETKNKLGKGGELAQQLRVLAALAKDLGLVPHNHL